MTEQAPAPSPQPTATPDASTQPQAQPPEGFVPQAQYLEAQRKITELGQQISQTQQAPSPQTPSGPSDFGTLIKQAQEQYAHSGQIAPGTYEAFKSQGLQQGDVDFYVNAAAAHQAQQVKGLMDSVGGEQQYQAVKEWAGQHLEPGMQNYFDSLVQGGHVEAARIFMQGLASQMQTQGLTPEQAAVTPSQAPALGQPGGYTSKVDWQKDMNDPRYAKDKSFREQADAKAKAAIQRGVW